MRQVILFVVRQCPEQGKWVNDKYIEICCLEKQDQIFTVSLLEVLLKQEDSM